MLIEGQIVLAPDTEDPGAELWIGQRCHRLDHQSMLRREAPGHPGLFLGVGVGRLGQAPGDLVQRPTSGGGQLRPLGRGDLPVQRCQPRGQCRCLVGDDAVAGRPGQQLLQADLPLAGRLQRLGFH